jgi:hypothetical protein
MNLVAEPSECVWLSDLANTGDCVEFTHILRAEQSFRILYMFQD